MSAERGRDACLQATTSSLPHPHPGQIEREELRVRGCYILPLCPVPWSYTPPSSMHQAGCEYLRGDASAQRKVYFFLVCPAREGHLLKISAPGEAPVSTQLPHGAHSPAVCSLADQVIFPPTFRTVEGREGSKETSQLVLPRGHLPLTAALTVENLEVEALLGVRMPRARGSIASLCHRPGPETPFRRPSLAHTPGPPLDSTPTINQGST